MIKPLIVRPLVASRTLDRQTSEGHTPDRVTPDGQTPDRQTADGYNPDRQTPNELAERDWRHPPQ